MAALKLAANLSFLFKEYTFLERFDAAKKNGGPGVFGLAAVPGREVDFRQSLTTAIDYAVALKCPRIHMLAGVVDSSIRNQSEEVYVLNLKHAATECAKHNITVLIEPISSIPNYFLTHQQQAVDIIKKVDCPNVKIEFDTYHAQRMDGNLTEFFKTNFQFIDHVQISQVPGRHEPNDKGEINFPFLLDAIQSFGYKGWIACEYVPATTTEAGLDWMKGYH